MQLVLFTCARWVIVCFGAKFTCARRRREDQVSSSIGSGVAAAAAASSRYTAELPAFNTCNMT